MIVIAVYSVKTYQYQFSLLSLPFTCLACLSASLYSCSLVQPLTLPGVLTYQHLRLVAWGHCLSFVVVFLHFCLLLVKDFILSQCKIVVLASCVYVLVFYRVTI